MPTEETITLEIRTNLKVAMIKAGVRQGDLAAALGLRQQHVSRRMNGHGRWSVNEIIAVAAFLGVPVSELVPDSIVEATP